jgi:hypothetical protein
MDALFITMMVIFILLQIPLGNAYLNATADDVPTLETLSALFIHPSLRGRPQRRPTSIKSRLLEKGCAIHGLEKAVVRGDL